ncbi:MAG: hypothetical protein ACI9NG_001182 [Hyphomonas sp.]|jgi:hypothetical protein
MFSRELPKFSVDPLQTRVAGQFAARVSKKARLTLGRRFRPIVPGETESLDRCAAIVDWFTTISASEIFANRSGRRKTSRPFKAAVGTRLAKASAFCFSPS